MTTTRRLRIIIDQIGDAKEGISALAGGLGGLAGPAAAATTAIAALGAGTVTAGGLLLSLGSDAEEMQSKFNVVFGEAAPEAARQLDEFGNSVGRNRFALMEMAASVQDTFVPMGFARDQAAELSVGLTQLAVDVASFNNAQETDVMADFQSALVGNHETVRKYGIVITETVLNQELLNMGIAGGTKEATEAEKVQARMNLIMQGTTDAQGDAARTSDSFANQMRGLKAELSEAATAMGMELLPMATEVLKEFTPWIQEIMPQAVAIFKQFAGDMSETVGPAMLVINDAITRMAQAFGVNTEEVTATDVILGTFKAVLDSVVTAVQLAAVTMSLLADGVEAVRDAVDWSIGAWHDFEDAVGDAVDAIPDWLIPHSPTPFEVGLRGIAGATGEVANQLPRAFTFPGGDGGLAPMMAGGLTAPQVVVQLHYAPIISTADRFEAEQVLAPLIGESVRDYMAGRH